MDEELLNEELTEPENPTEDENQDEDPTPDPEPTPTPDPEPSVNSESILDSIKKMIGLDPDYTAFDLDIIILINSAFSILYQLGVGPVDQAYKITSSSNVWSEFLSGKTNIESVKVYIYLKVKVTFDPPSNSFVLNAYNDLIKELEWRLNVEDDPGWKQVETVVSEEDD